MNSSKLVILLKTFDEKKQRSLEQFLASPYFNTREDLCFLFRQLKKHSLGKSTVNISREALYRVLFLGEPYNERRLNYLISDLFKLVETFIKVEAAMTSPERGKLHLMQYYLDKNLLKHFNYVNSKFKQASKTVKATDEERYLRDLELAEIGDRHFHLLKDRRYDPHLQWASDALDQYFIIKKLKFCCQMLDRQEVLAAHYEANFKDEVLIYVNKHPELLDISILKAYYLGLKLQLAVENEAEAFERFKANLFEETHSLQLEDQKDLYYLGINHCLKQFRKGTKKYASDLMELYSKGLEKGILLDNGFVSPWTFKNVVKLGLGLHRFDWTKTFINDYAGLLNLKHREDVVNYNMAELYYYQKAYPETLEYLNKTKFMDIYYNLHAKVLLIKIYVEIDEVNALDSLLASFSIFLQRKKEITKDIKLPYQNFIKIVILLRRYQHIGKLDKVRQSIDKTKVLTDRNWLLKQLEGKG